MVYFVYLQAHDASMEKQMILYLYVIILYIHTYTSLRSDPQQTQVRLLVLLAVEHFPSNLSFWPFMSRRAFAKCHGRSGNVSLGVSFLN